MIAYDDMNCRVELPRPYVR